MTNVCSAIWTRLNDSYVKIPNTSSQWEKVAQEFAEKWQFPNCIGALDGKHIIVNAPERSGSLYYNYKGTFSIILMALADANNCFLYIDVGSYGRNSDGGVYSSSSLGVAMKNNLLNLPNDKQLQNAPALGPMPFVIVADEAFPLSQHMMRPFPGKELTRDKKVFNYRLSRARRIIECAFGLLVQRWRVLESRIGLPPDTTIKVVKACCVLHNIALGTSNITIHNNSMNTDLLNDQSRQPLDASEIRNCFKTYFNANPVPWQDAYIDRGMND